MFQFCSYFLMTQNTITVYMPCMKLNYFTLRSTLSNLQSIAVLYQRDKIELVSKQINMKSARKDDYRQENQ